MAMGFTNDFKNIARSGSGIPTMTPTYIGQVYVDNDTLNIYTATATNGAYNWAFTGKGASSSFDVDTVSNMFAWWDASENITYDSGNIVTTWVDKVNGWGLTVHNSPEYVAAWENGKPAVKIIPDNNFYLDHADTGTANTSFSVISIDDTYTGDKCVVYGAAYVKVGVDGNPSQFYIDHPSYTKLGTYTTGSIYLIVNQNTGSDRYAQLNDDAKVFIAAGSEAVDATKIGGTWGTGAYDVKCHIAEHIIYNASLSDENIAIVKAYLNNKYAIY